MSVDDERMRRMKMDAFTFIDRYKGESAKIGDAGFYFAELGMQEFKTSSEILPGSAKI